MVDSVRDFAISHKTMSKIAVTNEMHSLVETIKSKIKKSSSLFLPLDKTLDLVDQLTQFDLGRFLLFNQGLNGYWTSYIFQYQNTESIQHPLEKWLLTKSLLVAARERFHRFKNIIQTQIKSEMILASLPCGLMDDLLQIDYSNFNNVKLVGIDIDTESLALAKVNAATLQANLDINFLHSDAWNLQLYDQFDLIASNGLNMYENDEGRLIKLYKNFHAALKKEGSLIVTFLPPPPENYNEFLLKYEISEENLNIEFSIFRDILGVKYLNFCNEEQMKKQLELAGFIVKDINYSYTGVAPVLRAVKV